MPQLLDLQKERKKVEKKLREIAILEKSPDTPNPNQVAKLSKKDELMAFLMELDVSEHGLRSSSIPDVASRAASQVKDAHNDLDSFELDRLQNEVAQSKIGALEQENCQLRTQLKTGEEERLQLRKQRRISAEEHKKLQRRQGQMATQADRDCRTIDELKGTIDSQAAKIEAQSEDFKRQLEDLSHRHSKEKVDLQRGIEQMKKTVARSEGKLKKLRCDRGMSEREALCEERRCVAETVAADLFEAGHHLEAFLRAIEPELLCPITYELPDEPTLAADGHTYDGKAIAKWMTESPGRHTCTNSPMTGAPMKHTVLTPNFAVRKLIALYKKWRAQCPT